MTLLIRWRNMLVLVIILNILVVALLALGMFLSFRRGLKHSLVHFCFIVAACLVAMLITSPITNALLDIGVGVDDSGNAITLESYIYSNLTPIFDTSNTLNTFSSSIVSAVIGPVVFLIVVAISCVIFEIVYHIINKYCLNKSPYMQEQKSTKKYGIVIGMIECCFLFVLAFMPMTSLTTTVKELAISQDNATESEFSISNIINNKLPAEITDFVDYYNSSPLGVLTNWGNLSDAVFDTVSPIYAGDVKISLKQDLVPVAKEYDKAVNAINDTTNIDYQSLREAASSILDSKAFMTVVEGGILDILDNKEAFATSLNVDRTMRLVIIDTLTNLENTIAQDNFDLDAYIKQNVNIALYELENNININSISTFINAILTGDSETFYSANMVNNICNAIEGVSKLSVAKDLFPFISFWINQIPAAITDFIDINYLDTYQNTITELPYIINVIKALSNSTDTSTGKNLLETVLSGDTAFMQKLVNNANASDIFQNMASSMTMRNIVINAFERMDNALASALSSINITINNHQLTSTIGFDDTEDIVEAFMQKASSQATDIIAVAKIMIGAGNLDITNGQLVDMLKQNLIKYYDPTQNVSNSVFTTIFQNIIDYFEGNIQQSNSDAPAFDKSEQFIALLNEAYAKVPETDKIYGEYSIYLTVSWADIFEQLL